MPPVIPWYITIVVIGVSLTIAGTVWYLVSAAAARSGLASAARRRVRTGAAVLLGGWLAASFLLVPGIQATASRDPTAVPPVILFAGVALLLVLVSIGLSPSLRRTIGAIPVAALIGVQVWRLAGLVFVALLSLGKLPPHFALPAGWGDFAVGLAALPVAVALFRNWRGSRTLAVGWNLFGLLDLAVAVGMGSGLLVPLLAPRLAPAPPATAMQALPMILVPAFAVPLSVMMHLVALRGLAEPHPRRAALRRATA